MTVWRVPEGIMNKRIVKDAAPTADVIAAREWHRQMTLVMDQLNEGAITYREAANAMIARTARVYDDLPMTEWEAESAREAYNIELHDANP